MAHGVERSLSVQVGNVPKQNSCLFIFWVFWDVDVNECKEKTHKCDTAHGACSNTDGSYKCSCKKCYILNGVSCELLRCSNLLAPIHGRLSSLDTGCGSVVSFSCLDGFARSSGSQKRKCNPNGRWSGKSLLCKGWLYLT